MMETMDIAFPNLGIYLSDVPKSISVFGFSIAFYGMIIGCAILIGLFVALKDAKQSGQKEELYWDFLLYAIFISIICARLYYVIFSFETYKHDLLSIFNIRLGGLAIYGGVIGALLTLLVYVKVKKQSFFQMADTAVLGLVIGQAIGRFGNFMNREAFGGYTNNILAMRLPIEAVRKTEITSDIASHIAQGANYIQVHPTFLYESIWNILLFFCLWFYKKKKKFQGEIFFLYLAGYGLGRLWIEGLRTDQLLLWKTGLPISQVLGCFLFMISTSYLVLKRIKMNKN